MKIKLTTTGSIPSVNIIDLGNVVFVHPTNDYLLYDSLDLNSPFNFSEVSLSKNLQEAIIAGSIVLTDENNNTIGALLDSTQPFIPVNALSAPTINDDNTKFVDGTMWINKATNPHNVYYLRDGSTPGAALWERMGDIGPAGPTGATGATGATGTTSVVTNVISDTKANNTAGGGFTSGAWQIRTLNTIAGNGPITINTNQITIPAGTYLIKVEAPAYRVDRHQCRLFNITDNVVSKYGSSNYAMSGNQGMGFSISVIEYYVVLGSQKVFRIEHQCSTTRATDGFGIAANFAGNSEVYTQVTILKL